MTAGRYLTLTVRDTGCGMDAHTKAHLFEPFFTTKEFGKGTGLGLSTVYGIIRQSGGYIRVESELGHGAVFKTYWPQAHGSVEAPDLEEDAPATRSNSGTILVVEDESAVRKLICKTLRKAGYAVLEASNGSNALTLCESYRDPIHLVISDVVMPGMSGLELAKRLSSVHAETRVLYISGYTHALPPSAAL